MAKLRVKTCDSNETVVFEKNYGRMNNVSLNQIIVEEGEWILYNEDDFYGVCILLSKQGGALKKYAIAGAVMFYMEILL
ncbi:MAG: hypothetical protein Q4D32_06070 [Eubacteriales bacterium]|nr:hypothetical protein [Eubacteriales bacterium]